ncbi:hypothetical protein BC828DRAFT_389630 [Blastocladiella britannica]|nr:hypothetical protein BC828DRAFT_389630 [Blastocladiella britannica]
MFNVFFECSWIADALEYAQKRVPELVSRCESLAAENQQLHRQLETAHEHRPYAGPRAQGQVQGITADELAPLIEQNQSLKQQLANMRAHVEQAEEAHQEQLGDAHETVSALKHQMSGLKTQNRVLMETKVNLEGQVMAAAGDVAAFEADLATTRRRLEVADHAAATHAARVIDLEHRVTEITDRFQGALQDAHAAHERIAALVTASRAADIELGDARAQNADLGHRVDEIAELHSAVVDRCGRLEKLMAEEATRSAAAAARVRYLETELADATRARDLALAEKDTAVRQAREAQAIVDSVVPMSVSKADVDRMRGEHERIVQKLTAELKETSMARAAASAELERALREKRASDEEALKAQEAIPRECHRAASVVEEMAARVRQVERERADVVQQLNILQNRLETLDTRSVRDRDTLADELESATKRATRAETMLEDFNAANLKLTEQLADVNKQLSEAKLLLEQAKRRAVSLEQGHERKLNEKAQEHASSLAQLKLSLEKTTHELSNLRFVSSETVAKLKLQHTQLSRDTDLLTSALREQLSMAVAARDDALRQLKQAKARLDRDLKAEQVKCAEQAHAIVGLQARVRDLETKVADSVRVAGGLAREKRGREREQERVMAAAAAAAAVIPPRVPSPIKKRVYTAARQPSTSKVSVDPETFAQELEMELARIKRREHASRD